MDSNINSEKSLKPSSLNDLRQKGGGIEQSLNTCHYEAFLRHPEADSRHSERSVPCGHPDSYGSPSACLRLKQESTCHENNKIERHPGGFPLCRENVTKCHIFER